MLSILDLFAAIGLHVIEDEWHCTAVTIAHICSINHAIGPVWRRRCSGNYAVLIDENASSVQLPLQKFLKATVREAIGTGIVNGCREKLGQRVNIAKCYLCGINAANAGWHTLLWPHAIYRVSVNSVNHWWSCTSAETRPYRAQLRVLRT